MRQSLPKAVLFDLDNTLVDRRRSIYAYSVHFFRYFSESLGEIQPSALAGSLARADGGGYREKTEVFSDLLGSLPWSNPPSVPELENHWLSTFPRAAVAMEGLRETLDSLVSHSIILGIVTNGGSLAQNGKIDALGLRGYMGAILVSAEIGVSKPDRRIFEAALAELSLEADEAWFVGDNPIADIRGAEAAGLTAVWMRGSHSWPDDHDQPRFQIGSLPELIPLVGS